MGDTLFNFYEGTDPAKYDILPGSNLNKAPNQLLDYLNKQLYLDSGTVNAIVLTGTSSNLESLSDNFMLFFKPAFTNTSRTVTIKVNEQAAKSVKHKGEDVPVSFLEKDKIYILNYDSTNGYFEVHNTPENRSNFYKDIGTDSNIVLENMLNVNQHDELVEGMFIFFIPKVANTNSNVTIKFKNTVAKHISRDGLSVEPGVLRTKVLYGAYFLDDRFHLLELGNRTINADVLFGLVPIDVIPNLPASKVTSGEFALDRMAKALDLTPYTSKTIPVHVDFNDYVNIGYFRIELGHQASDNYANHPVGNVAGHGLLTVYGVERGNPNALTIGQRFWSAPLKKTFTRVFEYYVGENGTWSDWVEVLDSSSISSLTTSTSPTTVASSKALNDARSALETTKINKSSISDSTTSTSTSTVASSKAVKDVKDAIPTSIAFGTEQRVVLGLSESSAASYKLSAIAGAVVTAVGKDTLGVIGGTAIYKEAIWYKPITLT